MPAVPPWRGALAVAARGLSGPRVLPTLRPLVTTVVRLPFSHTARMVKDYTGRLGVAQFNGATFDIPQNVVTGMIDSAAVLAWWAGQPGGGNYVTGPYPRLRAMECQNKDLGGVSPPTFTGQLENLVEASMPVLDPNNIKADGFWPASMNGYSARENMTTSSPPPGEIPVSPTENNTFLTYNAAGAFPAASNTGNNSIALVVGSLGNIGTAAAGSPSQNCLIGMNNATAGNRLTLCSGDSDWTQRYGLGFLFGTVSKVYPPTASLVRARMNRQVILMTNATPATTVIDGQAGPVQNIRVNGDNAEHFTTGQARASSPSSGAGFLKVGQIAAGTAATGISHELYAVLLYSNALVTLADGDQRPTVEQDLINIFNVPTSYQYQLASFGSSSIAGYRANTGLGILADLTTRLTGVPISVETYAMAGTSLITAQEPNRVTLSSVQRTGMTKTFAHWLNARNDLVNGSTGAAVWTAAASVINQFLAVDGWDDLIQSTLFTSITTSTPPPNQATFDAERAAFNAAVLANAPGLGALTADPAALAECANFDDYTFYDDQIHTRGGPTGASTAIAAQLEAIIRANL